MWRASSSPARRTPTTSASSTCVSLCAREWQQRSRPSSCSTCCSRAVRTCRNTTWRARAHCSTRWPRVGPDAFCRRSPPGDQREPMPPVPRPDDWWRSAAAFRASRDPRSSHCSRHSGRWNPIATWRWRAKRSSSIAARPPLAGPRVLLAGAPVDGHALHAAIESHGAIVVAEVGPWGSGAAGDDVRLDEDPVAALADKYRADAIGARDPRRRVAPMDARACWTMSTQSSCRCRRKMRCSGGTIRRCATC